MRMEKDLGIKKKRKNEKALYQIAQMEGEVSKLSWKEKLQDCLAEGIELQ